MCAALLVCEMPTEGEKRRDEGEEDQSNSSPARTAGGGRQKWQCMNAGVKNKGTLLDLMPDA